MSALRAVFLSWLLLSSVAPWAADRDAADPYSAYRYGTERGEFDYDDSADKPWRESAIEIPPLPDTDAFEALALDSLPDGMRAYLHVPTLSVGERDLVVRYWLLLIGDGGGFNATYEGVRCNTGEFKVYAYGNPRRQPKVRAVPEPKWRAGRSAKYDYHRELTRDYLCAGVTPRTVAQIKLEVRNTSGYEDPLKQFQ